MGDYSNAINRLYHAVKMLATEPDDIKCRLRSAYLNQICLIALDEFPEDLRPQIQSIHDKLNKKTQRIPNQYPIDATLYRMHKSTASKIAKEIWDLYVIVEDRRTNDFGKIKTSESGAA